MDNRGFQDDFNRQKSFTGREDKLAHGSDRRPSHDLTKRRMYDFTGIFRDIFRSNVGYLQEISRIFTGIFRDMYWNNAGILKEIYVQ